MEVLLAPLQLGCGTPSGCKAAVHATHLYIHNLTSGQVLLKLDFKNAFNCVRRDRMLMAVKESTSELLVFVYSAYAQPSSLFCRDHIIQSSEGVQQGDPLGPGPCCFA